MARSRIRPADGRSSDLQPELDEQQLLVLTILREARGAPVDYATLKAAGLEWPASVVCELELLGWPVERTRPTAGRGPSVRLDPARDPFAYPPTAQPVEPAPASQPTEPAPASQPAEPAPAVQAPPTRAVRSSAAPASQDATPPPVVIAPPAARADRRDAACAPAKGRSRADGPQPAPAASLDPAYRAGTDPEAAYRVYHARPWAGVTALIADAARLRRARAAIALLVATGVVAALALAGVFSGGAHASRTAARLHTRGRDRASAYLVRTPGRSQHAGRSSARSRVAPSLARASQPGASSKPAGTAASTGSAKTPAGARATAASPTTTQPSGGSPINPLDAVTLEAEGHTLLGAGDYGQAIPVLRRALAATGENTGACLQPANQACLTYAYALYDLATALRLSGDPAAAVPLLQQRLEIDNQRPVVEAELALARQQAQRQQTTTNGSTVTAPADGSPSTSGDSGATRSGSPHTTAGGSPHTTAGGSPAY